MAAPVLEALCSERSLSVSPALATSRSASPKHGFTIMNRLSMENRTEPITKDLDFLLQDPFLLYRNARCESARVRDCGDCRGVWCPWRVSTGALGGARLGGGWHLPQESLDGDSVTVKVWVFKAHPPQLGCFVREPEQGWGGGWVLGWESTEDLD